MQQTSGVILIVDDEEIGREALESLLINHGYQLLFATNGAEAFTQAIQHNPDLLLLDVMMPGMDGFEVCRRIRQEPMISEIPIIMVTSLDDRDSRIEGIEAGADDFITKPFDRVELRSRVRTITRLNRHRRLLNERARFEWVVEQANDGFIVVDQNTHILYANTQARNYLNLPTNPDHENYTPITESFLTLAQRSYQLHPQSNWEHWNTINTRPTDNSIESPPEISSAHYLIHPETSESHAIWLQVDQCEFPNATQKLIRLRDVSEEMTRHRQMWTFHSLISHKLASPVSSLVTSLHILDQGTENLSSDQVAEFRSIALQSATRLRVHIQEIRDYINSPNLARTGKECIIGNFPALIDKIKADVEIETVLFDGNENLAHLCLVLSEAAIEIMLRNILENAKKFHPSQTPVIEIILAQLPSGSISIRVLDDGITLAPIELKRVWMPYYQAEKDFSGQVAGMGLGLSLVSALLWSVGGKYTISNRDPGPGIVVELIIPTKQEQ